MIRLASAGDAVSLTELCREVATLPLLVRYGATAEGLARDLLRIAETQEQVDLPVTAPRLLLAEQDPRTLVGFARFLPVGTLGAGGYLQLIALRPGHEGQGLGARLLQEVEGAVALRSAYLFLLTSDFNHGAQRFYERMGYLRGGALPEFARPGITEVLYYKRLR